MDEPKHPLPYPDWACSCGQNFDSSASLLSHMDRCPDWGDSGDDSRQYLTVRRSDTFNGDRPRNKPKRPK